MTSLWIHLLLYLWDIRGPVYDQVHLTELRFVKWHCLHYSLGWHICLSRLTTQAVNRLRKSPFPKHNIKCSSIYMSTEYVVVDHTERVSTLYMSYPSGWHLPEFAEVPFHSLTLHVWISQTHVGCPTDDMISKIHMHITHLDLDHWLRSNYKFW